MLAHFPERHIVWDTNVVSEDIPKTMDSSRDGAWRRSRDLFKGKKVKWAINKFKMGYSLLFFKNQSKH
jgi:hypothetical protein